MRQKVASKSRTPKHALRDNYNKLSSGKCL